MNTQLRTRNAGTADQAAVLRCLAGQQHPATTLAVTSGKGGVGKTNVAVNLSIDVPALPVQHVVITGFDSHGDPLGLGQGEVLAGDQLGQAKGVLRGGHDHERRYEDQPPEREPG